MTIDKTKALSITMAILALAKLIHDYITTKSIDFTQADTIGEGIVVVLSIINAIAHHDEVKIALNTPTPSNE